MSLSEAGVCSIGVAELQTAGRELRGAGVLPERSAVPTVASAGTRGEPRGSGVCSSSPPTAGRCQRSQLPVSLTAGRKICPGTGWERGKPKSKYVISKL